MADNIWDNSDADNDGNVAANWSLGWVPKAGDVAVFDHNTTDDNCTFSGAITCDGMRFDNAYAGTVDAATYDITLGTSGLDCTGGGSATLDLGSGTWTLNGGTWDMRQLDTLTKGSSTVECTGTCVIKGKGTTDFNNWTIASGTTTLHADTVIATGRFRYASYQRRCRIGC